MKCSPGSTQGHLLGRRLDRAGPMACPTTATGCQQLAPYAVTDFNTFVGACYPVAVANLNPVQLADWQRTISINYSGFSPQIKRVSSAQKRQLMGSGRAGGQAFFVAPGRLK